MCQAIIPLLTLNDRPQAIVMTRAQFDHLAPIMRERGKIVPASWSMTFYPKSGHMRDHGMIAPVYPLPVLPKNFGYFRWHYGPGFPKEWARFAEQIQGRKCPYVLFDEKENEFVAVDVETGIVYTGEGFVGGGRVYHEPSATPYHVSKYDEVIE